MSHPDGTGYAWDRPPQSAAVPDPAPPALGTEARTGVLIGLGLLALGAPLGLLWAVLTPHLASIHISPQYFQVGRSYLAAQAEEDPAAFGGDAVMIAILSGTGLIAGLLGLWPVRRHPLGTVAGIVIGGLLGGAVCMAVGHIAIAASHHRALAGPGNGAITYQVRPYARGRVDMVVLPIIALIPLCVATFRREDAAAAAMGRRWGLRGSPHGESLPAAHCSQPELAGPAAPSMSAAPSVAAALSVSSGPYKPPVSARTEPG